MFKGLSDDLEEDEDLHNKLKSSDQANTSDEQIAADNVKISTLETSISGDSARVAQLTEEIDTLEKDIAASKSEFSRCDRDLRETVGGILRGHKSMSSDIENSMLLQLKASFLSFQGTPEKSMKMSSIKTSQEKNILNRVMNVSSFVQFRGTSENVPLMPVRAVKCRMS